MENTITAPAPQTSHLLALAIKGLEAMYDPEKGLFCHRLRKTAKGLVREGISHRYTVMTLLGLLRAQSVGLRSPVDIEAAVDRLFDETAWLNNLGDLGLLLWLCAAVSRQRLRQFHTMFDLSGVLERFPDARRRVTMQLSWFLSGLAHASKGGKTADLEPLADEAYRLVRANQGPYGLFGHMATWHSLAGVVRGRVGSFADQVYPILAMAHFLKCLAMLKHATALCNAPGRSAACKAILASGGGTMTLCRVASWTTIPCIRCISTVWRQWRCLRCRRRAAPTSMRKSTRD